MTGAKISSIARPAALAPARPRAVTVNSSSRAALLRPNLETLEAFRRYAQHPTDDSKGQRLCNVPDEIEARRRATRSSSSAVMVRIRGSSASTARGVNASLTNRRSRVCSGGSTSNRLGISHIRLCIRVLKLISDNTLSFVPTISPQISPTGPGKAALFGIKRLSKTF